SQDRINITSTDTGAIQDTGTIAKGTINRNILQGQTGSYRFESPKTYLKFDGTGTYPAAVSMMAQPETTLSQQFKWQLVGGTASPANNTVTFDSVTHFTKWAIGLPRPTGAGVPILHRDYVIHADGGN